MYLRSGGSDRNFGTGEVDRRADVDEVQFRLVARRHPGADVRSSNGAAPCYCNNLTFPSVADKTANPPIVGSQVLHTVRARPFLSVIVPAYNEQARITAALARLDGYLHGQSYSWEVVVVDDGSSDATGAIVREWAAQNRGFRLEEIPHNGKGAAVRHGMLSATGVLRFMCDADLAMPIEHLPNFISKIEEDSDIVIASRQMDGARRQGESPLRYFLSRLFNGMVRVLVLGDFSDTQCGFKCFRADAAEELFTLSRTTGWTFDVEILHLARRRNMRVAEIPIECRHDRTGVLRTLSMALVMLWEIAAMVWRTIFDVGNVETKDGAACPRSESGGS